jgi:surfeit locus 1 family protein
MLQRILIALAAAAAIAATVALGFWQLGRAHQKVALQAAIEARGGEAPLDVRQLLAGPDAEAAIVHRPIVLRGRWVAARTVFLDNRQMDGRQGFYVVTPLALEGRQAAILVQRGWVPRNFEDRTALPPVKTPAGVVEVRGHLAPPPAKLFDFGGEEHGPIRQNLDLKRFRAETGLPLLGLSVQQAGPASEGLLRHWPQAGSGADTNYGYAFQWWAIATLIAILYVWFQFLRPRRQARRP